MMRATFYSGQMTAATVIPVVQMPTQSSPPAVSSNPYIGRHVIMALSLVGRGPHVIHFLFLRKILSTPVHINHKGDDKSEASDQGGGAGDPHEDRMDKHVEYGPAQLSVSSKVVGIVLDARERRRVALLSPVKQVRAQKSVVAAGSREVGGPEEVDDVEEEGDEYGEEDPGKDHCYCGKPVHALFK